MPADDLPTQDRSVVVVRETRFRSIAKAVSWRIVGSLDTLVLSYLFTGSILVAGSIASTETVTKTVLYYLHERGWALVHLGRG